MNFGTLGTGFGGLGRGGAGVAYEAEAVTLFAAMLAAGSEPDSARKTIINTLIAALKTAGIWTKLDIVYTLAAHSAAAAIINWKNPGTFDLVAVNTPTFAADEGYTGNGSSSRLRTQYTPSTHGVQYTLNDSSAWEWVKTNVDEAAMDIGNASNPRTYIISRISNAITCRGNEGNASPISVSAPGSTSVGMTGIQRTSASTLKIWRNGSQAGASQTDGSSPALPTQEQWICGANATNFSTRQIAFAAWGASLNGLETSFYNAVDAYMSGI